ncbi:MAG TPA: C4-dicarboxylate ABC transporter permease, partial [Clostridiaceae bacterium]|nr:C4-dicarboxylate ABC transporter permease [Clostridiaceae bacterium]
MSNGEKIEKVKTSFQGNGSEKTKVRKTPHAYVIMLIIILIATILAFVIPSGTFDRVEDSATGKTLVIADSFKYVEKVYVNIFQAFQAIPKGIQKSSSIIAFIFLISGSVQIIKGTGALDAAIINLVRKLKGKDTPLLVVIIIIFSLLGAIFGFAEETMPFIALGVAMGTALGYDRVVGFHIVRTAAWVGFAGAFLNPFTIGVAQSIAELPLFSGLLYRLLCYAVFMIIGFWFILSYAKKVKEDPKNSIIYGYEGDKDFKLDENFNKFTTRHKLVLLVFLFNIIFLLVGVLKFNWYTTELAALFLGFGIICGLVGKLSPNQIAKEFTKGMSEVTFGAIIVGFARAIVVILEEGVVLDTIIYGLSRPLLNISSSVAGVGMFLVQWVINFFIGSGSGQAAATMPIMVPLSDIIGITRQTA